MGETLAKYFALIDADKDGGVDQAELDAARKLMPRRRRDQNAEGAAATGQPGR
jgi:Ca2+-binding EF-hand superfamily protein